MAASAAFLGRSIRTSLFSAAAWGTLVGSTHLEPVHVHSPVLGGCLGSSRGLDPPEPVHVHFSPEPTHIERTSIADFDLSSLKLTNEQNSIFEPRVSVPNTMNRVDPYLATRGRAEEPGKVTARKSPSSTTVVRIALTGGPCAGKSSALAHLAEEATMQGFDVYTGPEGATMLMNSGCRFPIEGEQNAAAMVFAFQKNLMRMQLATERALIDFASTTGRPSIIIFDRGMIDGKAYCNQEMWDKVLTSVEASSPRLAHQRECASEEYILGRYDMVLHLVTAADGAEECYKWGHVQDDSGNSVYRHESPAQARTLDKKMQEIWRPHSHVVVIDNATPFKQKLEKSTEAVMKIALEKHPQQEPMAANIISF